MFGLTGCKKEYEENNKNISQVDDGAALYNSRLLRMNNFLKVIYPLLYNKILSTHVHHQYLYVVGVHATDPAGLAQCVGLYFLELL